MSLIVILTVLACLSFKSSEASPARTRRSAGKYLVPQGNYDGFREKTATAL